MLTFYALRGVRVSASADKDFVILTLQNKKNCRNTRSIQKKVVILHVVLFSIDGTVDKNEV